MCQKSHGTLFHISLFVQIQQMPMGGQYMVRAGMPPGSQGQTMYPQQPGQQFQRMQGNRMLLHMLVFVRPNARKVSRIRKSRIRSTTACRD